MVGDINATDADAWDALTFSLVPGALDNDLFSIDPNGTLTSFTTFDYETMDANLSVRTYRRKECIDYHRFDGNPK